MSPARDTIFALSSGRPPAAIAVVRVSGPQACAALESLSGRLPQPRQASLARLRDPATGESLDEALALWFPSPRSETREDMAELQLHGGRAVIAAVGNAQCAVAAARQQEIVPRGCRGDAGVQLERALAQVESARMPSRYDLIASSWLKP